MRSLQLYMYSSLLEVTSENVKLHTNAERQYMGTAGGGGGIHTVSNSTRRKLFCVFFLFVQPYYLVWVKLVGHASRKAGRREGERGGGGWRRLVSHY